jgi:hypothetical protein
MTSVTPWSGVNANSTLNPEEPNIFSLSIFWANTWVQITWCAGDLLEADSRYTHHLGFGVH